MKAWIALSFVLFLLSFVAGKASAAAVRVDLNYREGEVQGYRNFQNIAKFMSNACGPASQLLVVPLLEEQGKSLVHPGYRDGFSRGFIQAQKENCI